MNSCHKVLQKSQNDHFKWMCTYLCSRAVMYMTERCKNTMLPSRSRNGKQYTQIMVKKYCTYTVQTVGDIAL